MEDCNMLAADCVVISCCCQCLFLQITIFIFFKLPCKLIKKTRAYTMKKLQQRKRKGIVVESKTVYQCENDIVSILGESMRSMEEIHSCRCCIEEVDKVLEEMYQRGDFGFGSFWGGGELGFSPTHRLGNDDQFDPSFVRVSAKQTAIDEQVLEGMSWFELQGLEFNCPFQYVKS
ncbi:hypothetical protein ACLB2K_034064 [Fragaria x ananassa]